MIRNRPKWTIYASGGLGLLQIISKDTRDCVARMPGSWEGWIVRSHIGWKKVLQGCGNLYLVDTFKNREVDGDT